MDKTGQLDPIRDGFTEGVSEAVKTIPDKVSKERLFSVFRTVSDPLGLPRSDFAMPKGVTIGRDMGNYVQISEQMPTANGGTLQTVEIGSGVTFVDLKKQQEGVRPSPDNIKILIERDENGGSRLSASIRGQELSGFETLNQKDAAKMIGQMAGRVQLGQTVSIDDMATRLRREVILGQSLQTNTSEKKAGTFRLSDIQARL